MTEETIRIGLLKAGDPAARERLVSLYGQRLLKAAALLCANIQDAPDVVQETFLRVFESVDRFKEQSSLYTWLYGILLNVCRQHYRKQKRHILLDNLEQHRDPGHQSSEKDYERRNAQARIIDHMHTLSPRHREVLILRYYEELKIHEIAQIIGVNKGTVKSRLHYAAQALRKTLPADLNLLSESDHPTKEIK